MFSCEFFEISKNNFSYRTTPVAAYVKCTFTPLSDSVFRQKS